MKRISISLIMVVLSISFVCFSPCIMANAKYYNIVKKAGGPGVEVKIGARYFYYENRSGSGKAYRYYKYYTKAMRDNYICPGDYYGKQSWTNGKRLYYIIKNKLYKVKLHSGKIKTIKLGQKMYKYKIKKIYNSKVYILKSRKKSKKTITYSIKSGKVNR